MEHRQHEAQRRASSTALAAVHERSARDEVREVVTGLLPWGISLLLHAGVMLLAAFAVWVVMGGQVGQVQDYEPFIIQPPGEGTTMNSKPSEVVYQPVQSPNVSEGRYQRKTPTEGEGILDTMLRASSAGVGGGVNGMEGSGDGRFLGMVIGTPSDRGVGGPSGGAKGLRNLNASPEPSGIFGQVPGGGAGPDGPGGSATSVVYLLDASGSLIDSLPFVLVELRRHVGNLPEKVSFTVVFFRGEQIVELPPVGLKRATEANRKAARAWLSSTAIIPTGKTNPIPALQRALSYRPQIMYLLSDNITGQGIYEVDQKRLLAEIAKANRSQTRIHTIQFLHADKLTAFGGQATMSLIAKQNRGSERFVDAASLGLE